MVKECIACRKQELDKDTIGINKKMLGTEIKTFYYNGMKKETASRPFFMNLLRLLKRSSSADARCP